MLEKVARMNLLYDFYGQLLTDRQKSLMEHYYGQNLSLGEIAEECGVTRQAVYDNLKRAEQLLSQYEEKLGLVAKYHLERKRLAIVSGLLEDYFATGEVDKIKQARELLNDILDLAGEQ